MSTTEDGCFGGPATTEGIIFTPTQLGMLATPMINFKAPPEYEYYTTVHNTYYNGQQPGDYEVERPVYEFFPGGWAAVPDPLGYELGGSVQNIWGDPLPTLSTFHTIRTYDPPSFSHLPDNGSGWQPTDYNIYPPGEPRHWIYWRSGIRYWNYALIGGPDRKYECEYQWWKLKGWTW